MGRPLDALPPARRCLAVIVMLLLGAWQAALPRAQAAVSYRLTFADREQHRVQVDVIFPDVPPGPLQLRMSRSSPGRYAIHEFSKNVLEVRATDGDGMPLTVARPNADQWDVSGHSGDVRVSYRVFGDRVDGTYLAIDSRLDKIRLRVELALAPKYEAPPAAQPGTN